MSSAGNLVREFFALYRNHEVAIPAPFILHDPPDPYHPQSGGASPADQSLGASPLVSPMQTG